MKRTLFALALAAALPMSAQASELSYSYIEGDYAWMSIDDEDLDIDPSGFGIKGSVAVGEAWYLFGGYLQGDDSQDGIDVDTAQTNVGIGWRHAISDKADFNGELSYVHQNVDVDFGGGFSGDADGDGYRLSAGIRGEMAENFEGYAKANWTDGSDFDGDFSGTIGAQVKFGGMWGITGEAEFGNDANIYMLGLRASF